MIESWLKHWDKSFNLIVYSEDIIPSEHPRIEFRDLRMFNPDLHQFITATHSNSRSPIFAKKAWPIMHHLLPSRGYLVWIDADVITENTIRPSWISRLVGNHFSAHLGVPQQGYYSVETGFFVINRTNSYKDLFLSKYKTIYLTRDFSNMYKPFDGDTFGRVIRECKEMPGFSYKELAPKPDKVLSPFNKVFKNRMWHLKGKHKEKDLTQSPRVAKAIKTS